MLLKCNETFFLQRRKKRFAMQTLFVMVDKSATKTLYFINKTADDSSKPVCWHHTCVWPVLPVRRRRAVEAMAALSQGPAPTDTCILVLYVELCLFLMTDLSRDGTTVLTVPNAKFKICEVPVGVIKRKSEQSEPFNVLKQILLISN